MNDSNNTEVKSENEFRIYKKGITYFIPCIILYIYIMFMYVIYVKYKILVEKSK